MVILKGFIIFLLFSFCMAILLFCIIIAVHDREMEERTEMAAERLKREEEIQDISLSREGGHGPDPFTKNARYACYQEEEIE